jgi:hypothetical protein
MLSGAILCFPAAWRLEEKLGRTLMRLHLPVAKHTKDVGRRVQRLMDAIRPETPMWRANAHRSGTPRFNPLSEAANRVRVDATSLASAASVRARSAGRRRRRWSSPSARKRAQRGFDR